LLRAKSQEELTKQLAPKSDAPSAKVPGGSRLTPETIERRWQLLKVNADGRDQVLDSQSAKQAECYQQNIENFIGTVKVPIGLAGPLRVNGFFAQGDYYIPLATTQAAPVSSHSRGCQLISEAGGCTVVLLNEGVSRAPGFAFRTLAECGQFVLWVTSQMEELRRRAESTTRHGKLIDLRITMEGNHVYLNFEFSTGDASGQNMVTLATQAV